MKRIPVISSNLKSVGYDPSQQILEIEFQSGDIYQYMNVPQNIYLALINAPSKGSFFAQYIRYNRQYPCRKIIG